MEFGRCNQAFRAHLEVNLNQWRRYLLPLLLEMMFAFDELNSSHSSWGQIRDIYLGLINPIHRLGKEFLLIHQILQDLKSSQYQDLMC